MLVCRILLADRTHACIKVQESSTRETPRIGRVKVGDDGNVREALSLTKRVRKAHNITGDGGEREEAMHES